MRLGKGQDSERGATLTSQRGAQSRLSIGRFGGWISRLVRRSCAGGLWTISRDGKLMCDSFGCEPYQPE
jgi:hypothetical protein